MWSSEEFLSNLVLFHSCKRFLSTLSMFMWWISDNLRHVYVQQDASYQSKVVSNQSDLERLKRPQKCHSEMSSQNSRFSFICIAYTPDFRANFGHLPVNAEGHKNKHTFSRMPAISQKWFQTNRTSYGLKGLWNVVQILNLVKGCISLTEAVRDLGQTCVGKLSKSCTTYVSTVLVNEKSTIWGIVSNFSLISLFQAFLSTLSRIRQGKLNISSICIGESKT